MTGRRLPRRGTGRAAAAFLLLPVLFLLDGCGARSITVGSVPFPAEKPVFRDDAGLEKAVLPEASEPVRLVFIDSPWCPQCGEAWSAIGQAAEKFPPGTVRVYRILFDRERIYAREEIREVPPLRPPPSPETDPDAKGAALLGVTTLTALPGPFRKQYRVGQVPLLLLLDEEGRVRRRWSGYRPSLRDSLAEEVRRRVESPSPAER